MRCYSVYYFEVLSIFFFLLVLNALFSPMLGGCLVLFGMLFLVTIVVIIFSLNFIWLMLAGIVVYIGLFITKYLRWRRLPDFNQYVTSYSQTRIEGGVCCYNCGSDKIVHHGLFYQRSNNRYYVCSMCGSTLFRFRVL